MSVPEILTAIVAVYGALLATFTFFVQQQEKKRNVQVTLWLGFIADPLGGTKDIVIMEAANPGAVPVHLSNCSFHIPEIKKQLVTRFEYDKELPITLAPGESVQAWLLSERFVQAVKTEGFDKKVTVVARFTNKAGGEYSSAPEELDLDSMLYAKNQSA